MAKNVSARPYSPDEDLLPGIYVVEASAGTGKTYTICELFIKFVVEKAIPVEEILVVTFNVAATAELRDRLRRRLCEALEAIETKNTEQDRILATLRGESEGELRRRLAAAQAAMDQASIFTIHGFCNRVLQQFALEVGIEPGFDVVEKADDLISQVVSEVLLREMEKLEPWLVAALRGRGLSEKLIGFSRNVAEDRDLLVNVGDYREDCGPPDPGDFFAAWAAAKELWEEHWHEVEKLVEKALSDDCLNKARWKPELIQRRCEAVTEWFLAEGFPGEPPKDVRSVADLTLDKAYKKAAKWRCEHKALDALAECVSEYDRLDEALKPYERKLLVELIGCVRAELLESKRRLRVMTYQDMLVWLRDALREPNVGQKLREALRRRFKVALIDEFQDTDNVQWEIFEELFGKGTSSHYLYLVGDPKQAIYAFRGADVYAYLRARKSASCVLTLTTNWRSDKRLVDAVNALFGSHDDPFYCQDITYETVCVPEHVGNRFDRQGPAFEIKVVDFSENVEKERIRKTVYRAVASDIAELLNSAPMLLPRYGDWRRLRPSDVAVLVRRHVEAFAVQRALRQAGIQSVLHSEASVFSSQAALELTYLMRAMLNPRSRQATKTALATTILGLTIQDVIGLEEDEARWAQEIERFESWGAVWIESGFLRAFRRMLADAKVVERLSEAADGERLLTDLLHLSELLHKAERDKELGPEALFAWMLKQRDNPTLSSEERQLRLESEEDSVLVVTMHHAKGLEFPVVFCPFLWDSEKASFHDKIMRVHDEAGRVCFFLKDDAEQVLKERAEAEMFAESMRLAYVALTRARNYCVVYWTEACKNAWPCPLGWLFYRARALEGKKGDGPWALARKYPDLIAISKVDPERFVVYRGQRPQALSVQAASFDRVELDDSWRRASFTAWVKGFTGEVPGDDDAGLGAKAPFQGTSLLQNFERGRKAGQCLHELFERLDPACSDYQGIVQEVLSEYGYSAALVPEVLKAVNVTLNVPLPTENGPVYLREVSQRLSETDFLMPVHLFDNDLLSAGSIAQAFETYGSQFSKGYADILRSRGLQNIKGLMAGQWDLAFFAKGQWFLLDYKTNDLGADLNDYTQDRLYQEMVNCDYILQYHIYCVALYRYLKLRVRDFDWQRDFGRVFYVFVRGLDENGSTGIFWDRPSARLLETLSQALG